MDRRFDPRLRSSVSPTSSPLPPCNLTLAYTGRLLYPRPVANVLVALQWATEAGFVLLTLAAVIDWRRHRDTRSGHLGLAFGSLTALILIAPIVGHAGSYNQLVTDGALL